MVCRYLENRICYDSSSGSGGGGGGGGGFSDEDFDQGLQQDIAAAAAGRTRDNFNFSEEFDPSNEDTSALISATRDVLGSDRAARDLGQNRNESIRLSERVAALRSNVQTAVSNLMNPNITQPDLSDYSRQDSVTPQDPLSLQIQAAAADSSRRDFADPRTLDKSFFADAYDGIYGTPSPNDSPAVAPGTNLASVMRAGPVSQIFSGIGNGPNTADDAAFNVGQLLAMGGTRNPDTGAITGANAGDGTLGMNRFGMVTYSGMPDADYTGPFQNLVNPSAPEGGDNENAFPFANQLGQQVAQMAPGEVAPEAIDDLAINYLKNPYYAYSGFGNQYNPYGFASGTLVDLLQTRGMTQPEQADTLGLFGNPTDFS